jgi:hypothetical protein
MQEIGSDYGKLYQTVSVVGRHASPERICLSIRDDQGYMHNVDYLIVRRTQIYVQLARHQAPEP